LGNSNNLKMEAAGYTEMLVSVDHATRIHIIVTAVGTFLQEMQVTAVLITRTC
jgi:hypothetical protein